MPVTHCLCEKMTITAVLEWAKENGVDDLATIREHLGCSGHCGMCGPFIEYALATGVTVVPYPCPEIPKNLANKPKS